MDRTKHFVDIAEDMDADHERASGRNSVRHRTSADVMRSAGMSDDRIRQAFGYLPEPMVDVSVVERRQEPIFR